MKKHRFVQKELQPQHVITAMVLADRKTKYEWASNAQNLQKETKKIPDQSKLVFSNFINDAKLFQWAGLGFSPSVSEQIHQSVKRLAFNV